MQSDRRMAQQPGLPYLPAVDGLRAVAVLAVIIFHAGLELRGGFLGVESFFVISGFLITALLFVEWQQRGKIDLLAFWIRRARRLLPALLLLLAGLLAFAALLLPEELAELQIHSLAALAYVMNWFLIGNQQSYFDPTLRPPLLQHLWSLAVEEQFYLVWPLLFGLGMALLRWRGVLLATLLLAASSAFAMAWFYQPGADPSRLYYGTDTRAAGLLLGAALALVWLPGQVPMAHSRRLGQVLDGAALLAMGGLLACFVVLHEFHPQLYRGGFGLVALLTAVLIAASSHPQARLTSAVLGWEPLRWIGLRAYGLYLWHWPVFLLAQTFVDPASAGWATLLAQLALVLLLTEASYRMVELPFRQAGTTSGWQVARQRARAALQALAPVAVTRPHVVPLPSALRHVPTLSPEMFNAEAQRRRAAEVKSS